MLLPLLVARPLTGSFSYIFATEGFDEEEELDEELDDYLVVVANTLQLSRRFGD
jgi:hypothetical protein